MKKIVIGGTIAAIVLAGSISTPFYLGKKAQQSLETQHRILADTFFFDVVSHEYRRGWLESTETTVLRLHPNILANLGKQLPDNVRLILEKPITMINHVHHQPFANGIIPVRAVVDTEFAYDPEVQKTLARFFGSQTPLALHNVIRLNGDGNLTINIAAFDYEELSGIKLNWKGLAGSVQYKNGYVSYHTTLHAPAFKAILADKGSLNTENFTLDAESSTAQDGKTTLGSSKTSLGRFEAQWKSGMDYNIRLNDLINTVTDLQIGAFINPTGTIAPNRISIENLSYATQTAEPSKGYLNTQATFAFAKFNYGDKQYGPLAIDIAAEHINAAALNALKARWQQIVTNRHANDEEQKKQLLAAVRSEGAPLFTDNPVFKVNKFSFQTPSGYINASGSLRFTGLAAADLNALPPMIAKMRAELDLDVSKNIIEDFAITQTRSLFAVDDPNSPQQQQEISDTIRLLTDQSLDNMKTDGYISQENGSIKTKLVIADNHITLNGKRFQNPENEDLFAGLENDSASAPASAPAAKKR